jgi:hypothetical protein
VVVDKHGGAWGGWARRQCRCACRRAVAGGGGGVSGCGARSAARARVVVALVVSLLRLAVGGACVRLRPRVRSGLVGVSFAAVSGGSARVRVLSRPRLELVWVICGASLPAARAGACGRVCVAGWWCCFLRRCAVAARARVCCRARGRSWWGGGVLCAALSAARACACCRLRLVVISPCGISLSAGRACACC